MTAVSMTTPLRVAAMIGLAIGLSTAVYAQPVGTTGGIATSTKPMVLHGASSRKASTRKATKRAHAKARRSVAAQQFSVPAPQQKAWTLEDALPSRRSDEVRSKRDVPDFSTPKLGRVPFENGSFGFETDPKVKPDRLSDGSRPPGLESVTRNDPSYFGLSLSVPNNDKGFILPAPPWGRP
jgi:hypothetical protein